MYLGMQPQQCSGGADANQFKFSRTRMVGFLCPTYASLSLSLSLSLLVSYALPAALVQSSSLEGHENITLLVASRSKHIY